MSMVTLIRTMDAGLLEKLARSRTIKFNMLMSWCIGRKMVELLIEEAVKKEGISKIFGLVFKDNDPANAFWEKEKSDITAKSLSFVHSSLVLTLAGLL